MELFNSTTKKWVEAYLNNPKAATIIETNDDNESGVVIAKHLYEKLVDSKTIPFFTINVDKKKSIGIEDIKLSRRDGIGISDVNKIKISAAQKSFLLIMELPNI